jgi:zinc transporter ZupT
MAYNSHYTTNMLSWIENHCPVLQALVAGAMIFVVVEKVIPESQHNNNTGLATT